MAEVQSLLVLARRLEGGQDSVERIFSQRWPFRRNRVYPFDNNTRKSVQTLSTFEDCRINQCRKLWKLYLFHHTASKWGLFSFYLICFIRTWKSAVLYLFWKITFHDIEMIQNWESALGRLKIAERCFWKFLKFILNFRNFHLCSYILKMSVVYSGMFFLGQFNSRTNVVNFHSKNWRFQVSVSEFKFGNV